MQKRHIVALHDESVEIYFTPRIIIAKKRKVSELKLHMLSLSEILDGLYPSSTVYSDWAKSLIFLVLTWWL